MHCVDLVESFQTQIYLQNLASIQPRTSPLKFAGDPGGRCAFAPERGASPYMLSVKRKTYADVAREDIDKSIATLQVYE